MRKENLNPGNDQIAGNSPADPQPLDDDLRRIRLLLANPMHKRTHFRRVRLPNGGSAL